MSRPTRTSTLAARGGLTLLALAGLWSPAHASLPDLIGLGSRAAALGGAAVATASDYEAAYYNPAGLGGTSRRFVLGAVYGGYRLKLDSKDYPVEDTAGLLLGGSTGIPLGGLLRDRLGLGLGLYLPFSVVNRVRVPFPDVPRAALLDTRTQIVSVLLGAGLRLPAGLSVGGGVLALAALVGSIDIAADGVGRITSSSEQQLTVDYAPIVGLRWQSPAGRVALGLAYRGESRSTYRIAVYTRLGDLLPLSLPTLYFAGTAQYDPQQLAAEAAVRPSARLLLSAQLMWKGWSRFPYPIERASDGSLALPPPGFHDTVVPRVAAEWTALERARLSLQLRGGYGFEWSPAPTPPPETYAKNLLDASRHVLSAGAGLVLRGGVPLSFGIYVQAQLLAHSERLGGTFGVGGATIGVDL
jgi:long-chain fatty acid transport protein